MYIEFIITSTGETYPANDGTVYELVLRYEGVEDYPLTQNIKSLMEMNPV